MFCRLPASDDAQCNHAASLFRNGAMVGAATLRSRRQLDHALENIVNDERWISDFIRRLNYAVEDMIHKK